MYAAFAVLSRHLLGGAVLSPDEGTETLTKPLEDLPDTLRCSLHEGRLKDELLIGLFVLSQLLHSVVGLLFLPFLEA